VLVNFLDKGLLRLDQLKYFVVLLTGRESNDEGLCLFGIWLEFCFVLFLTILCVFVVFPCPWLRILFAMCTALLYNFFCFVQINSQLLESLLLSTGHVIQMIIFLWLLILVLCFLTFKNDILFCCIILNQPVSELLILPDWTRVVQLFFAFDNF
jgi:hypothetical protein